MMPSYRMFLPLTGDSLPLRLDGKPFELRHGGRIFELRRPPDSARLGGFWGMVEPVEAVSADSAYLTAANAMNSGLNVLAARYDHIAAVGLGYLYQNLADPDDRGDCGRVQILPLRSGLSAFPEVISDDLNCRSGAFYRRGLETDDPIDRCRYLCLAIEEAGKRIRKGLNGATDEQHVIRDTIEEVFKKAGHTERLKSIRSAVPKDYLTVDYHDGNGQRHVAMNDFLYQHVRVLVMHAGGTQKGKDEPVKGTYAPYDIDDRRKVVRVLDVVTEIAGYYVRHELDLAEKEAAKAIPVAPPV